MLIHLLYESISNNIFRKDDGMNSKTCKSKVRKKIHEVT